MADYKFHILVCGGTGCMSSNSRQITENLNDAIKAAGMTDDVKVLQTGCFGFCEQGPIVKILPDKWTVVTADGSLSAHFEHTIAITPDGPKILTVAD